ncbi:FAD/NAD(P)-binding protein [Streptomyces tanashiensis]
MLERLAARCAEEPPARPLEVFAVDPYEAGAGRIWRTDQSPWFLMNTPAQEVTMFSGPADDGPHRPGAGPTLGEWWAEEDPAGAEPEGYAPRAVYGRYLTYVMARIEETLPPWLTVHRVPARVICADRAREGDGPDAGAHRLRLDRGDVLTVDRLVLATGHPLTELDAEQRAWQRFAKEHSTPARPVKYVAGGSASEMPLAEIPAGASVGILGMGLTFYDILTELTLGRGGTFTEGEEGLLYLPSGKEPRILAGSRGGVPLLTRGANQKGPEHRYRARLFTPERMAALRAGGAPLDFERTVLPWLLAEVNLVLLATRIRHAHGPEAAEEFTERGVALLDGRSDPRPRLLERLAAGHRIDARPLTGLDALARPFAGRRFGSSAEYHKVLTEWLRADRTPSGAAVPRASVPEAAGARARAASPVPHADAHRAAPATGPLARGAAPLPPGDAGQEAGRHLRRHGDADDHRPRRARDGDPAPPVQVTRGTGDPTDPTDSPPL